MRIKWSDLGRPVSSDHLTEQRYHCPFCSRNHGSLDSQGHLYANRSKGLWICHRCGAKGRVTDEDSDSDERIVTTSMWEDVESYLRDGPTPDNNDYKIQEVPLPEDTTPIFPETLAAEYLASRGYSPDMWARYFLRDWVSRRRIVIPIYMYSRMVFWVARTYVGAEPKYINPTGVPRSVLFNYDTAMADYSPGVVIVEGVTSAMTAGVSCVATLGKYVSRIQIAALSRLPQHQYICMLDGDAQRENLQLARGLQQLVPGQVWVATLKKEEDPDSITDQRFNEVIMEAKEFGPLTKLEIALET